MQNLPLENKDFAHQDQEPIGPIQDFIPFQKTEFALN